MLEVNYSPQLSELIAKLDDSWEAEQVEQLPFPLAYTLTRLRQEDYAWDFLLKDMLHIVLKYLATIAASDYLKTASEPDFDVNEYLQKLALNMSEGHWFKIIRACAGRNGEQALPELPTIFGEMEGKSYTAKLIMSRISLQTQPQGIFSTLITARNRLLAHDSSLTGEEKRNATPLMLGLVRAMLALCAPIWSYDLIHVFGRKTGSYPLLLRGTRDFEKASLPNEATDARCFLGSEGRMVLQLYPLVLSDTPGKHHQPSILDEESELYIINQVARKRIPSYSGLNGGHTKRKDLSGSVSQTLEHKRVWDKRNDLELDTVFEHLIVRTCDKLDDAISNKLYSPDTYVDRPDVSELFAGFLTDSNSRAMIISGTSGCGKTAAILNLIQGLLRQRNAVMLIRALELNKEIVKPKRFERWLTAELGYNGRFSDVLQRVTTFGDGQFVLVVDGLNEYTAAGRDASLLFRAINQFLADHADGGAVKVLMTFRAESLNVFLPGGELPPDAADEVYYKTRGRDYAEIGLLTAAESMTIMKSLQIPADMAQDLMVTGGDKLRNPQMIRKIAGGSIEPRDIKDLESTEITRKFLDRRLGRDRDLRRATDELVKIMGKAKDMVLSEQDIEKRSPKLHSRLLANDGRMLTTLGDLELIQRLQTEDESGNVGWSIALTHDTLFEALTARQLRRGLIQGLLKSVGAVSLTLLVVIVLVTEGQSYLHEAAGRVEASLWLDAGAFHVPDTERADVRQAYSDLAELFKVVTDGTAGILERAVVKAAAVLLIVLVLLTVPFDIWNWAIDRRDRRDKRVIYYGKAEEHCASRRFLKYFGVPGLAIVAWVTIKFIVSLDEDSVDFWKIVWPLAAYGVALIFIGGPWIAFNRVRTAVHGSNLLREYTFSNASRSRNLHEWLRIASSIAVFGLFAFALLENFHLLFDLRKWNQTKTEAEETVAAIDVGLLEPYALRNLQGEDARTFIEGGLKTFVRSVDEYISEPILSWSDPAERAQLLFLLLVLSAAIIMLGVCTVLVQEWAARKYYIAGESQ